MKICQVISGDVYAGAEVSALNLIDGLLAEGEEVDVVLFNNEKLFVELNKRALKVEVIEERECKFLTLVYSVRRYLKSNHYSIVHTHGIKESFVVGLSLLFSKGEKVVRTHHGKGFIGTSWFKTLIEKINGKFFTNVLISVSEDLKKFIKGNGVESKHMFVLRNAILNNSTFNGMDIVALRDSLGVLAGEILIGSVGRISPVKDHKTLVLAFSRLLESYSQVKLIIVGDGPQITELQQLLDTYKLNNKVKLLGFRDNIMELLSAMDVFVLPSLHEGVPMVLLEAMACNTPIIASDVGGIPEVIDNGVSALLFRAGDVSELTKHLSLLIENPSYRHSLSESARNSLSEKFNMNSYIKNLLCIYRSVID